MMLKALVRQIDAAVDRWLPLAKPRDEKIVAWGALHGWDTSDVKCQRLLLRQALLNATIHQTVQGITHRLFPTPLESLGVEAPRSVANSIYEAAQPSNAAPFNFWGELYSAVIPQSERRRIGQFWTHEQIAEWMVTWLLGSRPRYLANVGCGAGNFLLKAAESLERIHSASELYGCDLSPLLLNISLAAFLTQNRCACSVLPTLEVRDYLSAPLPANTEAVICNPPYTRHHHITPASKDKLQEFFKMRLQLDVSRLATLAFYFLLKLIAEMPDRARAAVIVPMQVLDARYGKAARRALCQHTALSAIINFSPRMNAFQKVDVGASILLFTKGHEKDNRVHHLTLNALPTADELLASLDTRHLNKRDLPFGSLFVQAQDDLLGISKWFGIATPKLASPDWQNSGLVVPLKALAKVVRGIATGANEFFALPTHQVKQQSLEPYVVRTLQRNREIQDIILDEPGWQALSDQGRRVWLLYLNSDEPRDQRAGTKQLRAYLANGEARGYNQRSLVQTRKKWYAMEQRAVPPIFFTILTRGNPRFILNLAGVRPLNMFSLIYPNRHIIEAGATEIL